MHYRCNVCNSGMAGSRPGLIPTPDGRQWQICPACDGAGVFEPEPIKEPTWYPVQIIIAAALGTNQASIQIQNRDIEVDQLQASYTGGMLITILDGGRPWMIAPNSNSNQGTVPIQSVTGTAQNPFELRPRYRLAAKSDLTIIITDTSNAANNTLNFSLFGYSLVPRRAA